MNKKTRDLKSEREESEAKRKATQRPYTKEDHERVIKKIAQQSVEKAAKNLLDPNSTSLSFDAKTDLNPRDDPRSPYYDPGGDPSDRHHKESLIPPR